MLQHLLTLSSRERSRSSAYLIATPLVHRFKYVLPLWKQSAAPEATATHPATLAAMQMRVFAALLQAYGTEVGLAASAPHSNAAVPVHECGLALRAALRQDMIDDLAPHTRRISRFSLLLQQLLLLSRLLALHARLHLLCRALRMMVQYKHIFVLFERVHYLLQRGQRSRNASAHSP